MKRFLLTGEGTENLDDKKFSSHHKIGKIADYLLWDRQFIAELKQIEGYPSVRMNRLMNEALRQEPRIFIAGTVGMQRVLAGRENGAEINEMMVTIGGRPVRKMLQHANSQISDTRLKLQLAGAAGLAIVLIDKPQKIEASIAAYAVRAALQANEPALKEVDVVWVSMETHQVALPDGRLGYPELIVWRANRRSTMERYMMGQMIDAWAQFNDADLENLDHTLGWHTLNPIGSGWPLSLQQE
ncbi:hypothetical protein [Brevundimonas sp.]|jgi:hypothetical protein|uniref:hypothetical protein n=1 Tax=Brevundimonas sp. TaxID=1871086 RepID=UPI0037C13F09